MVSSLQYLYSIMDKGMFTVHQAKKYVIKDIINWGIHTSVGTVLQHLSAEYGPVTDSTGFWPPGSLHTPDTVKTFGLLPDRG